MRRARCRRGSTILLGGATSENPEPHASSSGTSTAKLTRDRLPDAISLDLGALIEPLSVALHARDRAALPEGSTVLVFGAGAVGLLAAAVSKAAGAKSVVIADIQKERVDFAVAHGFADASVVVPMARPQTIEDKLAYAKDVAESVKGTEVGGQAVGEVSAVYECTGVETCLQSSIYVRSFPPFPLSLHAQKVN
jgi:L-iditol 2-dehydrogenase